MKINDASGKRIASAREIDEGFRRAIERRTSTDRAKFHVDIARHQYDYGRVTVLPAGFEPERKPRGKLMPDTSPTLLEAFALGKDLESFIHSSHCFDARDMGRFWCLCNHPQWVVDLGKEFDRQVNWAGTKDQGVMVAHKVIREALERIQHVG